VDSMLGKLIPAAKSCGRQWAHWIVVCQSIAQPAIRMEFEGRGVTQLFAVSLSSAVGLLVGGESFASYLLNNFEHGREHRADVSSHMGSECRVSCPQHLGWD
jgi:hypothetical protein